jgi:hypothetical protein
MKWIKSLFPMWDALVSINNDESGPGEISKNNLQLAEELKDKPPMNANEIKEYIKNKNKL